MSHEAGSYGPSLIHLGLSILRGQTVAPYNYVSHKMVTRDLLDSSLTYAAEPIIPFIHYWNRCSIDSLWN